MITATRNRKSSTTQRPNKHELMKVKPVDDAGVWWKRRTVYEKRFNDDAQCLFFKVAFELRGQCNVSRIDSNAWKCYFSIQNFNHQIQRQGWRSWHSQTHQEDYRANLTVNAEISPSLLKIPASLIYLFILLQRSFIDLFQKRVHFLGKKLNWRELITLPKILYWFVW